MARNETEPRPILAIARSPLELGLEIVSTAGVICILILIVYWTKIKYLRSHL